MRKLHQLGARAPRITILALGTLTTLALAVPASAAQKAPGRQHRVEAEAPGQGMMVAIDPATGKIRQPTAAETQALTSQVKAMMTAKAAVSSDPQVTTYADGTMSAVIPPQFLNVWMVQLNADGTTSEICVDGANAANAQPAVPAFEEK